MEKTIESIYSEMLAVFSEASGYTPSSSCDLAARLYAAAAQVQSLYLQAQWLLDQCFPQTAAGEYLDRHAQMRDIRRNVATRASGKLRFGVTTAISGDLSIKSGTVCMTKDGVRFATTADAVLAGGTLSVDVPATALEPGRKGNVAANTVTIMAAMPVGVKACTNPEAFSGGEDEESDEDLRLRLLDSYRRPPNGANAAYYEQAALSFAGVAAALAVGCPRGVGTVDLYIATDGSDITLLTKVNRYLQERREISVNLQVKEAPIRIININVAVQPAAGYTFETAQADAEAALRAAFNGTLLGKAVTLAFLGNLLYDLESIQNYKFTSPTGDIAVAATVLPRLGTVTISKLEA